MIPKYLHEMWTALAPTLGDHLWQSTLFAVAAGLLTLILRKNHARARYWLWLAASLKFLVPFSLLVGLGSHLSWSRASAGTSASLYVALEQVSRPFTESTISSTISMTSAALPSTLSSSLFHLLPAFLAAVWLVGLTLVLSVWCVRWQKISAAMREAMPLHNGREVEALRRIERIAGIPTRIEMLMSSASLEPGIFGIAHPILVWPEGISEHLEDAHLEAILTHEVWHVRRRDNLAAALHMVVEAIFWFHPLVWWLGARLVDERERACDEEVLELGGERQIYAESILKTCEFCVGSPLACVSGITGADLKNRIVHIMTQRVARKLDFRQKLLLGAAGLLAIAVPITFGLARAPQSQSQTQVATTAAGLVYEVASVKPDKSGDMRFKVMNSPDSLTANTTLQMLIRLAYSVEDNQISGAPNWVNSDRYDVEAKMDSATADEVRKLSEEQEKSVREHMLQALLVDRFKLTIHRETKELPIYSLVVAKNGSKLEESKPGEPDKRGFKTPDGRPAVGGHFVRMGMGQLDGHSLGMTDIARLLSQQLGRTVVDKTGLTANYDFTLKWTPEEGQGPAFRGPEGSPGTGSTPAPESGPSIFTAVQEQLGLKLESQKGPVEILVIDHVEKPSEN
jgi:bla regulator protein blaR1